MGHYFGHTLEAQVELVSCAVRSASGLPTPAVRAFFGWLALLVRLKAGPCLQDRGHDAHQRKVGTILY